ncbi:MAG TPA: hypothetical protein VK867_10440 [Candidatus Limnocylindrales bacterium]|nr:hypothetical protein [Candidatus Limnocylindrales bacterium]
MIQSLGRRLSLIFDRGAEDPDAPGVPHPGAAVLHPLVDFVAYADDCMLSGRIRLRADRLTDMLNDHEELHLVDVLVQSVVERESVEVREVVVPRDELLLVHATGPRGDLTRRTRTRLTHVALTVDRYRVRGYLHAAPFIDALSALHRRSPMVPLTDAVIDYPIGDEWHRQRVSTLIVNRSAIDTIVETPDHDVSVVDNDPSELEVRTGDLAAILGGAAGVPDPAGTA